MVRIWLDATIVPVQELVMIEFEQKTTVVPVDKELVIVKIEPEDTTVATVDSELAVVEIEPAVTVVPVEELHVVVVDVVPVATDVDETATMVIVDFCSAQNNIHNNQVIKQLVCILKCDTTCTFSNAEKAT